MKCTNDNAVLVIRKIVRLERERGIAARRAHIFIDERVDRAEMRKFSKSQFYLLLKPENSHLVFGAIKGRKFELLVKYLEINSGLYNTLNAFADISNEETEKAKALAGHYTIHSPSIFEAGLITAGVVEIKVDADIGCVKAHVRLPYVKSDEELDGCTDHAREYDGFVWYKKGHYILIYADSRAEIIFYTTLRTVLTASGDRELEGAYKIITASHNESVYTVKTILQPIDNFNALLEDDLIGYRYQTHKDKRMCLSAPLWERLNPTKIGSDVNIVQW